MSSMKRSPGPWKAYFHQYEGGWFVRDDHPDYGLTVARVLTRMAHDDNALEGNAHLIAAAPEMLEALKEFDEACSIKAMQGTKAVLGITELNRLWDMARIAIAKATGDV